MWGAGNAECGVLSVHRQSKITKCGEGKDAVTVFYFVIPRKAGGHYLVGTGSVGTDEPARKTESDVRAAAFTLSGR